MKIAKDGIRSKVRVGYDGKVYKTFRGTDADKRFANEVRVLKVLEARGCDFVPRLLDSDASTLSIVTTNCGHPAPSLSDAKADELFEELKTGYGVIHDDPFSRNITYHPQMGRFCVIDFELATVIDEVQEASPIRIEWAGLTRTGYRKPVNDDSLAVFSSEEGWAREQPLAGEMDLGSEGVVMAVSDGMGGVKGGDYASYLAVSELRRFLPGRMGDFRRAAEPLVILESAIKDLHDFINRAAERQPEKFAGMGATLVCGLFCGARVYFAHVGDSRIYRFRAGELQQLTMDHSRVGAKFRDGKLNEREARNHPQRNVLLQVIGAHGRTLRPQLGASQLKDGDWYLFCSDGVIDGLWDKNIRAAFENGASGGKSAGEVAEELLAAAVSIAGKDDTTLIVVKVTSAAASIETGEPALPEAQNIA